jgi:hypothetical protein
VSSCTVSKALAEAVHANPLSVWSVLIRVLGGESEGLGRNSLNQFIIMGYYTSSSNNSTSGLGHDIIGRVFREADNGTLLLCHGGDGSGKEDKGKEEGLSELHFGVFLVSLFVL